MTALTCDELAEMIADFLAGELEIEIQTRFVSHIGTCAHCGRSVDLYRLTVRVSRALPKVEPLPVDVERRLRAALAIPPGE